MVDPFEERAKLRSGSPSKSKDPFEERARLRQKPEETLTLKGSAGQYISGLGGGVGGLLGEFAELKKSPLGAFAGPKVPFPSKVIKPTHELSESFSEEMGIGQTKNATERILKQAGEWGGLEGLLGTATAGPIGGALGTAHGSASGTLYGGLKELGMPDEWALVTTAAFTLSPIAVERLMPKIMDYFKKGKSLEEVSSLIEKTIEKETISPVAPSMESPIEFPFPTEELPTGRRGLELAEEAGETLKSPIEVRPEVEVIFPKEKLPEMKEAKPLTGRVKVYNKEIGETISPEKFEGSKQGGLNLSGHVKSELKESSKKVNDLYKKAEKIYKTVNDIVPELSGKVEDMIAELELTGKPSTAEGVVLGQLKAFQNMIGTKLEPIEVGMDRLVKQANSMSQAVNYEIPDAGVKKLLKGLVKDINDTVLKTVEKHGKNPAAITRADKAYAKMAETFFNDEIAPFLERNIRNPEALYESSLKDYGKYRALQDALYKNHPESFSKYERGVTENIVRPFIEDVEKIGSRQFDDAMVELRGLIGNDTALKVEKELKELKRKNVKVPKEAKKTKPFTKNITHATEDKVSKILGKSPEQIDKMLESPSGIKELKKELKDRGAEKLFDDMVKEKTIDILRGGRVAKRSINSSELYEEITKKNNYEVLSEFYGKGNINKVLDILSEIVEKEGIKKLRIDMFKKLGKIGAYSVGAGKLFRILSILLKQV